MSRAELEHFQTGAAVLLPSILTDWSMQARQTAVFFVFFCRSFSIILASREPALIHSFLLWVKEESRKDKRTRGCFDKRHMGCLGGESCRKMLGALIRPHPSQSLSVKETFPVLLGIYHLPSFSLGF